MRLSLSAQG